MGQCREAFAVGVKLLYEQAVLKKPHAVGIGEHIDAADITGRVLADIHGRGYDTAGIFLGLTCVNGGC